MNKLDVNNTREGRIFLGIILSVLLLYVSGWSSCSSRRNGIAVDPVTGSCVYEANWNDSCFFNLYESVCSPVYPTPNGYYYTGLAKDISVGSTTDGCAFRWVRPRVTSCTYNVSCTTVCEADSIACVSQGNSWSDDPSASCGKSCKINHCKAADSTWLSTSIAACTGSNNYAIVNTDSTCEHVGTCCPNDSIPSGNTCKWRCDSVLTACSNRTGDLFGAVLPDTSVSGEDTTFSYQCFYNCAHSPNPDSTVYIVEGNTVLAGPNDSIADGIKSEWFSSIRSTTGSIYVYDYLSPSASEYVDSIAAMKCVEHLWRCVINNKYVYWYDNQEVPAGCTNIVRVK